LTPIANQGLDIHGQLRVPRAAVKHPDAMTLFLKLLQQE
jgi:hypothetical protein